MIKTRCEKSRSLAVYVIVRVTNKSIRIKKISSSNSKKYATRSSNDSG